MSLTRPNASAATMTKNRVAPSPVSGLCVTCLDGCPGPCEVGKSALRGREMIYPQPFSKVTAGSEKDYPIDFSHFNIHGTAVGAVGVAANSDDATFPAVKIATKVGKDGSLKLDVPFFTGALGSTEIARVNWEGTAIGAAICGTLVVIGENVCGMDPDSRIENGRVVDSPELKRRVRVFNEWSHGAGGVVVQYNVEDGRLGVPEYAVNELGVKIIEPKWGQGAKDIGGEVKLPTLERALQLRRRGYMVFPDPELPEVQAAFKAGAFKEFERHSRLGMVDEDEFYKEVKRLRKIGAKYVTLKTGAYRPADLARAVKFSSNAGLDLLTVDGAGGGTGMSPWRMMNEWGVPTVQLECLLYKFCQVLAAKGAYVPPVAVAGGFALEDQVFKGIALAAPYVKAVCMGRSTMTAAMVGKTIGAMLKDGKAISEVKKYGDSVDQVFINALKLKEHFKKDVPPAAIGLYSYYDRLAVGLRQLMAGARKFSLEYVSRDDIFALTKDAAQVSGIPYVMDVDAEECDKILNN